MAEVVGLIAWVLTLAQLAQGVCKGLRGLHELFGELPGRLATLSNEVEDYKIVLDHLTRCLQEEEQHMVNAKHGDKHLHSDIHDEVALHVNKLQGHLSDLDFIVAGIRTTGQQSNLGSARRAYAWKKYHGRLNEVQNQIVASEANLRLVLDTRTMYVYFYLHYLLFTLKNYCSCINGRSKE
ncbi:uncharacterized protein TrAtP1_001282 [Trichoderma atroviride]|uniref:uncharacterized protein n=1 Tax=Hypocrea atroviridis TaxID=63577 RepID=UPI0033207F1E|nr:hypothetical protein TrAtP1_001282 [Trichoderma atroviride]